MESHWTEIKGCAALRGHPGAAESGDSFLERPV